jgi:hypothetical protein
MVNDKTERWMFTYTGWKKGLSGICRDRPPYMMRGVSRIGNPTYIWRYTTPIPNEPNY